MRSLVKIGPLLWLSLCVAGAQEPAAPSPVPFSFQIEGDEPGAWPQILSSVGLVQGVGIPKVYVLRGNPGSAAQWLPRIDQGALVVLEGQSELAQAFGFRPSDKKVTVSSTRDVSNPALSIVWERKLELPIFELPAGAKVYTKERWQGAPLVAGFRRGGGGLLWLAVNPGSEGYERFPYLLQALADLGLKAPVRSKRLWCFFDSSYRLRVDLDYMAARWRRSGISGLHVAAWHYWEPDPARDAYLSRLIEACHRNAILVYAWLELPHVSQKFWDDHPEWREKTALLQDAHLDWRRLMNLNHPDCVREVQKGLHALLQRADWDGVNLAELYFESLEGHENPARFTPLNEDVRREFKTARGFDPLELFQEQSPRHYRKSPADLRAFLDYRIDLARRMQEAWIREILRENRQLDVVVTHVDDQLDKRMRDLIGADAARLLPLLDQHDFTFLVEDPATVWHLGPRRYPQIAQRYLPLTRRQDRLAIDINIVERYQDVYPTKQQTGVELFQLVHLASKAFPRVALYFESSILRPDLPLLAASAATVNRIEQSGSTLVVESPRGVGLEWKGAAKVNGKLWPATDGSTVWLPAGAHAVEPAPALPALRLQDFTGDLKTAAVVPGGLEFSYQSPARAFAILNRAPSKVEIDGEAVTPRIITSGEACALALPRGQHLVTVRE